MNFAMTIYVALLFVLLSPGLIVSFPRGGSKLVVILVHAMLFALIYHFTHKMVWRATKRVHFAKSEGFEAKKNTKYGNIFPQSDSVFQTPPFLLGDSYLMN